MNLADAVKRVKRDTGYGTLAVTTDQATTDIINALNDAEAKGWRFRPWHFSLNEREISVMSGTKDYTLEASDGYIDVIYPQAGGLPLPRFTRRGYLEWLRTSSDADAEGEVVGYMHNGRDSSDKLKLRLIYTPTSALTLIAWCKKRLTEYAVADIATNTRLQYFPNEAHDLIVLGAGSRILKIQGKKTEAEAGLKEFYDEMALLWKQESDAGDRRLTSQLPSLYRRRKRARGGLRVA